MRMHLRSESQQGMGLMSTVLQVHYSPILLSILRLPWAILYIVRPFTSRTSPLNVIQSRLVTLQS